MQRTQLKEFYGYGLILFVLTLVQGYSVYLAGTTNLMLSWKHYLGFGATFMAGVLWLFRKPQYLFYALGLTLVLGYENLIGFTPSLDFTATQYYINNVALPVSYQDFSMYMLLIWAYVANNRLRAMAQALFMKSI
jgi:FtsH-binding integral membrane protein